MAQFHHNLCQWKDIHDVDQLISFLDTTQGRVVLQRVYENYKGIFPYSFEKI